MGASRSVISVSPSGSQLSTEVRMEMSILRRHASSSVIAFQLHLACFLVHPWQAVKCLTQVSLSRRHRSQGGWMTSPLASLSIFCVIRGRYTSAGTSSPVGGRLLEPIGRVGCEMVVRGDAWLIPIVGVDRDSELDDGGEERNCCIKSWCKS
jgi:hypothetical protein